MFALARFDRDALSVPGVSHIVLLEGINDIGMSGHGGMLGDIPLVTPQEMIAAYSQLIARAHQHRVKIVAATIMPFEGDENYFSEEREEVREAVNEWIRNSKMFDGVIDFDAAVRDPGQPRRLIKKYDGDGLHPNSAGLKAMGDFVDILLFE